jgi:IS605 OrfB family transposase
MGRLAGRGAELRGFYDVRWPRGTNWIAPICSLAGTACLAASSGSTNVDWRDATSAPWRADALHKFSRRIVERYDCIVVGDVSSTALVKTRMAKSVLDDGWGMLKRMLAYKGEHADRSVTVVSERNTTRACSGSHSSRSVLESCFTEASG